MKDLSDGIQLKVSLMKI